MREPGENAFLFQQSFVGDEMQCFGSLIAKRDKYGLRQRFGLCTKIGQKLLSKN
jgi:hypothetical protein